MTAQWHTIDSAPKDGTPIICVGDSPLHIYAAVYNRERWWRSNNGYGYTVGATPRLWMPMPPDTPELHRSSREGRP